MTPGTTRSTSTGETPRLSQLLRFFLRLGAIGFGGPQAHIAMMEDEWVQRRRWLGAPRFAQGLAFCNLLPGPASTQLVIWLGYEARGVPGGIASGGAFILPSFLMTVLLAALYVKTQTTPHVEHLLLGAQAAAVGIIIAAADRMRRTAVTDSASMIVFVSGMGVSILAPVCVPLLLVAAGLLGVLRGGRRTVAAVHAWPLFLFFLKAGALLFGGGLVLVPLLRGDLVTARHWLTAQQFMDSVAVGQVTPGPVVITSAFIGYLVGGGLGGAVIASVAMFLPSFLYVLLGAPVLTRVSGSAWFKAAAKAIAPAVAGSIFGGALALFLTVAGPDTERRVLALLLAMAAMVATIRWKAHPALVIVGVGFVGGIAGALL